MPDEWRFQEFVIEFEGIYPNAVIKLNEKEIGKCFYGYSGYGFRLDGLKYNEENRLSVFVDSTKQPDSRWYSGAGIYRPVWLWIGNKKHILPHGIRVSTIAIQPPEVNIEVEHTALSSDSLPKITIYKDKKLVAEAYGDDVNVEIPNGELWDTEHPNLYNCIAELIQDGEVIDSQSTKFGIRKLEWSNEGLFVNDNSVLLRGGCIHHDNGILGARSFREAEWRKIRRLKENGFNAVRSSHNPASVYLLEACDALGMYVMDETWDMWYRHKSKFDYASYFEEHWREDIHAMVTKDYNHPSVIMYSIGNEVSEPSEERGVKLGAELVRFLHDEDATRPVTAGINITLLYIASLGISEELSEEAQETSNEKMDSSAYNALIAERGKQMNMAAASKQADLVASPILDLLDIAGYNYASSRYEIEKEAHPKRIIVGSETFPYDLAYNWKMVEKYPYLTGDFMWSAWDYIGEVGLGAWTWEKDGTEFEKKYPWLLADTGAFDILGNDNAEAGLAAVVWNSRKNPYIGVVPLNHSGQIPAKAAWRGSNAIPYWSYQGCEGNLTQVEVYAAGNEVELFINDRSMGRRKLKDYKAIYDVAYEPGILKAIAYDDQGELLGMHYLRSAAGRTRIRIVPESSEAEPGEIVYFQIDLTGENGEIECNQDTCLRLIIDGGELLGFGSANPRTKESFISGWYTTYYGRSLAAVRYEGGQMHIKVEGGGMESVHCYESLSMNSGS